MRSKFLRTHHSGWGAASNVESTDGFWVNKKIFLHLNYLETIADFYGLKCGTF